MTRSLSLSSLARCLWSCTYIKSSEFKFDVRVFPLTRRIRGGQLMPLRRRKRLRRAQIDAHLASATSSVVTSTLEALAGLSGFHSALTQVVTQVWLGVHTGAATHWLHRVGVPRADVE
jgi:hypothetical protein